MRRSHAMQLLAAAGSATAIGAVLPRAARAQTLVPVRLVLFPGETSATAYYAKDRDLFSRAGLDVQITEVKNGAAGASAVAGGAMDIGFSNPLSLAQGHERGIAFEIIAPSAIAKADEESNGFIIVTKTSPIRTAKDLTGKTLAVDGVGGLPDIAIRNWIDKNGGDSKSVKFVELAFSEMMPALKSGRVDSSEMNSAFDPFIGKPNDTVHVLGNAYAALAPLYASSVWFATKDWIGKNTETTKKFMAVMKQSAAWANDHHHDSAVLLAPHLKRSVATIENATRAVYGIDMSIALVQPVIDVAAKYGLLKSAFPAADMISPLALK